MPPNVLLIILDSVRARNTSLHGHIRDTTPFLRQFAKDTATLYEQARAPGVWSLTSHTSIFTGLHVEEHGIASADEKLQTGNTIFEHLRDDYGYATGVFSENVWITDVDTSLKNGFETIQGPRNIPYPDALDPRSFVSKEGKGEYLSFLRKCYQRDDTLKSLSNGVFIKLAWDYPHLFPNLSASSSGSVYADLFLEWVSQQTEHWAACVNLMDAHRPYKPAEEHNLWGDDQLLNIEDTCPDAWELQCSDNPQWWQKEATEHLYDGAIHQADVYVERIIEGLKAEGILDNTLVIITSDHGEGFGEPSRLRPNARAVEHNMSIHEVLLHVPLVVKFPGQTQPRQVDDLVTLTNVPDVIRNTVTGEASPGSFVSGRPVVATAYELSRDAQLQQRASQYCDEEDLDPFDARVRCKFESCQDGSVRKYMTWRSEAATIAVFDAQNSHKVSNQGYEKVESEFSNFQDAGIRDEGEGVDVMDEQTYQRLQKLGYV